MKLFGFLLAFCFLAHAQGSTPSISLSEISLAELYPDAPRENTEYVLPQPKYNRPAEDSEVLTSFFQLLSTLKLNEKSLKSWFREDHITYLLDELNPAEKAQLRDSFQLILTQLLNGVKSEKKLINSVEPVLRLKVQRVNTRIERLKEDHKSSIQLALAKHEDEFQQQYAGNPYSYHLRQVRDVLKRFGFGPRDSMLGLILGTAAWLHDLVEDTKVTYVDLAQLFGKQIATIVLGVTKVELKPGMTKEEQTRLTLERTALTKGSRILKLADRIANVEEGVTRLFFGYPTKVHKYIKEWPLFKSILYVPGEADEMWLHLERLLTDINYAQSFALANIKNIDQVQPRAALHQECQEVLGSPQSSY